MMNKYFFLIAIIIGFASCSSNSSSTDNNIEQSSNTVVDSTTMAIDAPKGKTFDMAQNFCRSYQGKIGDAPVHFNIIKAGQTIKGTYYYDKHAIPIDLGEGKITKTGHFQLVEYDMNYNETGSFMGAFLGEKIEAVWQSPDKKKKLEVILMEVKINPSEQISFQVFREEKIAFYTPNDTTSPRYTFIYTALFPLSNYEGPAKNKLYEQFEQYFGEYVVKNNPWHSIEAIYKASFEEYKSSIKDFVGEEEMSFALNWSSVSEMEVLYNDKGVVSLANDYYAYSGGAHGNYGRNVYSYQIVTGERITLADLFSTGYKNKLRALIIQEIRKSKNIPVAETLADAGFDEDEINPTDNFYITNKGIVFYYSPYAIASYAAGATEVFIPFSTCKGFLKKEGVLAEFAPVL